MELKQGYRLFSEDGHSLLIVPYGIETLTGITGLLFGSGLLIVPYGIETRFGKRFD